MGAEVITITTDQRLHGMMPQAIGATTATLMVTDGMTPTKARATIGVANAPILVIIVITEQVAGVGKIKHQ